MGGGGGAVEVCALAIWDSRKLLWYIHLHRLCFLLLTSRTPDSPEGYLSNRIPDILYIVEYLTWRILISLENSRLTGSLMYPIGHLTIRSPDTFYRNLPLVYPIEFLTNRPLVYPIEH
jgi:hypothetical protein